MNRISVLLITGLSLTLTSCGFTRASERGHAREVSKINAVGVSLDTAREMAVKKGFLCDQSVDRGRTVVSDGVTRKTDILSCHKKSLELICPQRRYVIFNAYPATGKVYRVGNRITEHSCF
ncbi:hypothetical protein HGO37_05465 [Rhizobium sp. CG4]|uniref:hypothetical protein n=1 Tax=Rhizobium/Agrobacterium group TaxID=227290 RepID=UPI002033BAA6|nr:MULTISPECIES: hypothetical protein [Rhizobium/Agrobacterium group]MCM2454831.1 hypothetical protein [Rhizobium sp. CG4]MDO5895593.1 hypothetical protein [Agrobacterium sp. Azo12]